MKQKRITYGVYGMMEYQAVIQIGRSKMKVQFTDGTVTAVGVNPATFSTDNLMVQMAIEGSDQYKRGRIVKVSVTELDKEVKILRNTPKPAPLPKDGDPGTPAEGENGIPAEDTKAEEPEAPNEETKSDEAPEPAPEANGAESEQAVTDMEFACNDDAKDYLEKEFGAVRSRLRTRADIVAFGAEHGISITFEA